jgi:hypothetical protein
MSIDDVLVVDREHAPSDDLALLDGAEALLEQSAKDSDCS